MSFASLRGVIRRARKGLCPTCSKTKYPQLEAAGAGHVGCLIYTIETLGQLIKDEHEVTAVHVAARKGQTAILVYLVENRIVDPELTLRARNGATPAHDAAGTGKIECLRYLFSRTSAGPNDLDVNQATPLHWAIQNGHLKVVQWLIAEAHAPIDVAAKNGVTPLHLAAIKNRLDILRWMVAYAFRFHQHPMRLVNAKDKNGATPLYHAAHAGHLPIIQWLAEKGGGDPTLPTKQGLAPLHASTVAGHLDCVQYLFRFGRATAPGGIRTTEGACALHFAAAEGHLEVAQWLLSQNECSGNERDYFQSTPLHDAAESGNMKVIKLLCESGVDVMLPDVEGNRAIDMAKKNKHSKCVNYLEQAMKKTPRVNGSVMPRNVKLQRSRLSQGQMRDNFRSAPPHLMPVNAFEDDDNQMNEEFYDGSNENQWVTLHDLMDKDEIEMLSQEQDAAVMNKKNSDAEIKRRVFEMNLAKEEHERQKMKQKLLKRQVEEEKEMRKKFSKGYQDVDDSEVLDSLQSLDLAVEKEVELMQSNHTKGNVGKIAAEFDSKKGGSKFRKFLGRKAASSGSLPLSQSWDSGHLRSTGVKASAIQKPRRPSADPQDYWSGVPTAPPLPTVEFLLGKKSGKRAQPSLPINLKEELKQRVGWGRDAYDDNDADSDDNKPLSIAAQKLKQKRKKLQASEEEERRAKMSSGSPQKSRKFERVPTPRPGMPVNFPVSDLPVPKRLTYGDNSPLLPSPEQKPTMSPTAKKPSEGALKPSRLAPKPPSVPSAPISKAVNARQKAGKQPSPQTDATRSAQQQLMGSLNQALAHPGRAVPKVLNHSYHQASPPDSPTSTEIEHQLLAMQLKVGGSVSPRHPLQRQPAVEVEEDSDDSSFTSTSESSSDSDDSSDESDHNVQARQPVTSLNTARPIMARNMGLHAARMARQAMQRMKNQRYPSIFRKPIIKLGTITEIQDEVIYEKNTIAEQVLVFDRMKTERRYLLAWKQYIRLLKISRRKAERMGLRKRKAVLANAFYAWVQAKNVHDVELADRLEMATKYYEDKLKKTILKKWKAIAVKKNRSPTLEKTEKKYLQWINSQLSGGGHTTVDNLDKSLATGVAIIHAIEHASKKKPPKFKLNPKHKLHKLDNWKVAHVFMRQVGIRVKDFEPADLANLQEASIHNMFNCILKWQERQH